MANELETIGIIRYNKNGVKTERSVKASIDITGSKISESIQSVGTVQEELVKGDFASLSGAYAIIENLDDTNSVTVRGVSTQTTGDMLKVEPREFVGPLKFNLANIYVYASAGEPKIRVLLIEP